MTVALVIATKSVRSAMLELASYGGLIGASVSGVFLRLIGSLNLLLLLEILKIWRLARRGDYHPERLEELLAERGLTRRILGGRLQNLIAHSWQMYPIGLLFGLGFDTASEIGLLALAAGVATQAVPAFGANLVSCSVWRGHVVDGHSRRVFMSKAYGWALSSPLRKIYYDATTTGLSVAVALLVGTTELLQVLATQLKLRGEFLIWLATLDFESLNYFIVALFAVGWACSVAIWKVRRVDEGWESVS